MNILVALTAGIALVIVALLVALLTISQVSHAATLFPSDKQFGRCE
ncbi:MAG TPA: hypothetical protein VEL11_01700 [Candidatus Bathyarchaeia archaeon]|nr:hypothetical protein [Candidatus Bathyarchaeia archaeon]